MFRVSLGVAILVVALVGCKEKGNSKFENSGSVRDAPSADDLERFGFENGRKNAAPTPTGKAKEPFDNQRTRDLANGGNQSGPFDR